MSKLLKALRKIRIPVYLHFIISYLIIVGIVIFALIPIYQKALKISKSVYLKEAHYNLIRSCDAFENTAEAVWKIPNTLNQSQYYTKMKIFRDNRLPSEYYVYLDLARKFFVQQSYSIDLQDSFLYFENSGAVITSNRIFKSMEDYLSEQLIYEDTTIDEIKEIITSRNYFKTFIPVSKVSISSYGDIEKSGKFITLLTRQSNDSVVIGALFYERKLLELFNIPKLPENTFFYIKDKNNNIITAFNYNYLPLNLTEDIGEILYDKSEYSILRHKIDSLECEVVIGIPDNYFSAMLKPLNELNGRYIVIAIILGLVLSIIFALYNYLPLKKLTRIPTIFNNGRKKILANEYGYLKEIMERSDIEIQKLRTNIRNMDNILRVNLFVRLLHGNVNTDDEINLVKQLIPQIASEYRIAITKLDTFDDDVINIDCLSFIVYEQFSDFLPLDFLFGQLDQTKAVVLIPETNRNRQCFCEILEAINENIGVYNATVTAGLSEVFCGMERINTAFYHAQYSLLHGSDEESIRYYKADTETEPLSIDMVGLQRLYELLRAGKYSEVEEMLDEMAFLLMNGKTCTNEDIRKTFYLLRFIFETIVNDMQCETVTLPTYSENKTIHDLFMSFNKAVREIALELEKRKQYSNSELKKQVLDYINSNFSNKSMYAASIAEYFGISESYVYKLVKESTGLSLNDYIRKLRIEQAAHMLKTTDLSVANISDACGFDVLKTFYRTFKNWIWCYPQSI